MPQDACVPIYHPVKLPLAVPLAAATFVNLRDKGRRERMVDEALSGAFGAQPPKVFEATQRWRSRGSRGEAEFLAGTRGGL